MLIIIAINVAILFGMIMIIPYHAEEIEKAKKY